MNMVTIASAKVADLIAQGTGAKLIALSGNMCTDKKPAAINNIMGRGRSVVAGVALTHELIKEVFKTDAKTMFEVNYRKNLVGSARAGAMGFNAHAANVTAAMFIACGQDAAHAIDGSTCITTVDLTDTGVYVAVTLPSLPVGTVGGGTAVDTQQECLKLLGVAGSGTPPGTNAKKLAEIIGTGVLARRTLPPRGACRPAPCPRPPAGLGGDNFSSPLSVYSFLIDPVIQNLNHFIMTRASSPFA